MDYEKKYNEAFEKARRLYEGKDKAPEEPILEYLFPELRESEDEKIRKEIVKHIKDQIDSFISAPDCRDKYEEEELARYKSWIAYLEKQKEQHIPWYDYQKSKEAGYTIVPNEEYEQLIKQKEQNPIQSNIEKEYIRTIKSLISDFLRGKCDIDTGYYQKIYDWLDGRHIEPNPAEWSEEDEKMVRFYVADYNNQIGDMSMKDVIDMRLQFKNWLANRLKSLRPQPKQEWSEEDEKKILFLERLIKYHVPEGRYGYIDKSVTKLQAITMLKSLRPKPSWKPSEELLDALAYAIQLLDDGLSPKAAKAGEELEHLREQLKKL